ncbi:phospholipase c-beta-2-related [Anaeramoeba flamelloides]|uniref:Phospholipase c-beta-2-related n=1 Tax=Anaeramoeba flamelloides TaxID=1746091 RepID=A0AAV7ZIZ4_9EUKA|nr:phospholipase c-beta-2-related [Anaeramoeba flamelloides]
MTSSLSIIGREHLQILLKLTQQILEVSQKAFTSKEESVQDLSETIQSLRVLFHKHLDALRKIFQSIKELRSNQKQEEDPEVREQLKKEIVQLRKKTNFLNESLSNLVYDIRTIQGSLDTLTVNNKN